MRRADTRSRSKRPANTLSSARNTPVAGDESVEEEAAGTSSTARTTVAPNAQLASTRLRHELQMARQKLDWQQELVKDLTKDPEEVVARYRKVLKICRKGRTMGAAFKAVGVDRNTIVVNAPMAERCIAAPEAYAELKESAPKKEKLSSFAQRCKDAIDVDDNIVTRIKEYKDSFANY
ncbi:unnamed protein product [Gadus morhua 'NCC']